jgi:uncharacterized protein YdeI (YjbR/CyaY-like superfamily)
MTEAGMRAIEAAKRDGSWSLLDAVEDLQVPDDLQEALAADRQARRNFDSFTASVKKMALSWVLSAKRPATRARRISEIVRLAARNLTIVGSSHSPHANGS